MGASHHGFGRRHTRESIFYVLRDVVARALALLLLYAAVRKAWAPQSTRESFELLLNIVGIFEAGVLIIVFVAMLVVAETVVALCVILHPRHLLSRIGLLSLYSMFLCIVIVFAVWEPGAACGCGMPGPDTLAVVVGRSVFLF